MSKEVEIFCKSILESIFGNVTILHNYQSARTNFSLRIQWILGGTHCVKAIGM